MCCPIVYSKFAGDSEAATDCCLVANGFRGERCQGIDLSNQNCCTPWTRGYPQARIKGIIAATTATAGLFSGTVCCNCRWRSPGSVEDVVGLSSTGHTLISLRLIAGATS